MDENGNEMKEKIDRIDEEKGKAKGHAMGSVSPFALLHPRT